MSPRGCNIEALCFLWSLLLVHRVPCNLSVIETNSRDEQIVRCIGIYPWQQRGHSVSAQRLAGLHIGASNRF